MPAKHRIKQYEPNSFYHLFNRGVEKRKIFRDSQDYGVFLSYLKTYLEPKDEKTLRAVMVDPVVSWREKDRAIKLLRLNNFFEDLDLLAYCLMPNHFHLVLYPKQDGDVQKFMQWITLTHTQRWHVQNKTIGSGHLYQGRYKSFLIEQDKHLLSVIRYVERNPLRAKLVKRVESWEFSSLARRLRSKGAKWLATWPIPRPADYLDFVNTALTAGERESIRYSVNHGKPFGSGAWSGKMVEKFGLSATTRGRGRPKKGT